MEKLCAAISEIKETYDLEDGDNRIEIIDFGTLNKNSVIIIKDKITQEIVPFQSKDFSRNEISPIMKLLLKYFLFHFLTKKTERGE